MKPNKKLKEIEDKSFALGNKSYEEFMTKGGIVILNGAVRAYRCSMQALRYSIMFSSTKTK